ncbi:MAG TPA: nitrate reductase [Gaiellaceae bacterium]|nr:nitrate reductase [Gaiellaceae bacterium]
MRDRIANPWGERRPHSRATPWPERVDGFLADGLEESDVDRWVQSACVLCANGCGLDIAVKDGRIAGVRGRAVDRINKGRLGPKGLFGWQANNSPDRLTRPLVREGGDLVEADWETAMSRIVERSQTLLAERGPGSFGFYNSGQLFLEDYYTLGVLTKAGLGTPHVDGNTRLCTATAAAALKETFSSDGQPASYVDVEDCDTLLLVGHNVAETETVLWMRILDRLEGPDPPRLVVVDPRPTVPARHADVHLALRTGTNLALLNGLLHELVANGWIDREWIDGHTVGFAELEAVVAEYPPERVAEICGVSAGDVREAARILGAAEALLSTVLQGVYQSHQATASACQVNNVNLVRGMIGRPGAGVLQMNGQPTAQNTRETGADGDLPAFRNWQNPEHVRELAELWNVDPLRIPHHGPPTHALEIFRYAEQGSIDFLWVIATNPAVSLPELARIRSILSREGLFLVVQDCFLTETARFADVVLPAAIWGEKTGTFTNADRTVHLSEQAVDPPGEARPDLDIFLDYARRMGFTDRDGRPLPSWSTPEEAFEAWKACSRGRPCDYSGLSYEKLRGGSGIPWPCTEEAPDGTERLYTDGRFWTQPDSCEDYGHDLETGGANDELEYRALDPAGRAILKAAHYRPPHEEPSDEYPFRYTTGRTVYHFHTRTKTGRSPQLVEAAPDAWVELSVGDAERLGVSEGDWVRVSSPRGALEARARITAGEDGLVFAPFHYGYWDADGGAEPDGRPRAANELTVTEWDPVSKQPLYKVAAVTVERVGPGDGPAPAPTVTASRPVDA